MRKRRQNAIAQSKRQRKTAPLPSPPSPPVVVAPVGAVAAVAQADAIEAAEFEEALQLLADISTILINVSHGQKHLTKLASDIQTELSQLIINWKYGYPIPSSGAVNGPII